MKVESLKVFSTISILSVGLFSFSSSNTYAESNTRITNMEQLPFDLVEDVEVVDYEVNGNELISESEDFKSNINLESNEITYTDSEENTVSIEMLRLKSIYQHRNKVEYLISLCATLLIH